MPDPKSGTTPLQTDVEMNHVDLANKAVREYQAGKCTTAYARARLTALKAGELELVSVATRLPLRTLEKLRGS